MTMWLHLQPPFFCSDYTNFHSNSLRNKPPDLMRKLLLTLVLVLLTIGDIFSHTKPMVFAKWAPASLAAGKISVGSEFSFTRKSSVNLMVGIPASTTHHVTFDD